MKEQSSGLLKLLGPLAGDSNRLSGYDSDGVSVALNPTDIKPRSVRTANAEPAGPIPAVATQNVRSTAPCTGSRTVSYIGPPTVPYRGAPAVPDVEPPTVPDVGPPTVPYIEAWPNGTPVVNGC